LFLWLCEIHSVVVKVPVAAPAAVTVAVAKSTGAPSSKICPSI